MNQLQLLQDKIMEILKARGWDTLHPASISKSISLEAAELLENFQWKELSVEEIRNNPEVLESVKNETADVMIYCLQMMYALDIDTNQAIIDKLELASKKYPSAQVKDNHEEYIRIRNAKRDIN